ncbi:MAG: M23 family metallopeptidase [Saprospiraceae bacterium]
MEARKNFKEKLKDVYRLIIIDVEDLNEVGNYQFSMARLYTYVISSILLFSVLLISLIAFTPLKRLMPGYGDIEENTKFVNLRKQLVVLEDEMETQIIYTKGLQKMLTGTDDLGDSKIISPNTKSSGVKKSDGNLGAIKQVKTDNPIDFQYFVPPVLGSVSAAFDRSIDHFGVDILAPKNTAIKAITAGIIVRSDFSLETGNTLTIQHPNNVLSVYKHNSALLVKSGEQVKAGEAIAVIGNTGTLTDGPHLHFEIWYNGKPINPENFITFD